MPTGPSWGVCPGMGPSKEENTAPFALWLLQGRRGCDVLKAQGDPCPLGHQAIRATCFESSSLARGIWSHAPQGPGSVYEVTLNGAGDAGPLSLHIVRFHSCFLSLEGLMLFLFLAPSPALTWGCLLPGAGKVLWQRAFAGIVTGSNREGRT